MSQALGGSLSHSSTLKDDLLVRWVGVLHRGNSTFRVRRGDLQGVFKTFQCSRAVNCLFNNTHRISRSQQGQTCQNSLIYGLGALKCIFTPEMGDKVSVKTGEEGSH